VYGFYFYGHLDPSGARMPGYPAFLAAIYSIAGPGRKAVFLAQVFVDLATCVLTALLAARLAQGASEQARNRISVAALWLSALCPFTANYVAVPLTEVLTAFLTTLAILIFLLPAAYQLDPISGKKELLHSAGVWFLGGLVVGFATLVRPETPLLLAAILLVYWLRWRRPVHWAKLTLATLWITVGLLTPLAPWAARNAHTLGRVQFLVPRYAEAYGVIMPTGFYAWTKTWMFRSRDAYLFTWKLPRAPISFNDFPAYAFDSHEERSRVFALMERYNREPGMSALTDLEFARLARERTLRHPIRSYIWIPIERTAAMWFTPRIASLPYSGKLWPFSDAWQTNSTDFSVTLGLALINFFYVGLAVLGLVHWRAGPEMAIIVAFIVIRTAFLTQLQTVEPRYVLVCFPALIALGAQSWRERPSQLPHAFAPAIPAPQLVPASPACRDQEV
jgi:hypothetical protein